MSVSTMTSKGQVTIPADIRKNLHLKPGDKIDFQLEGNGTARIFPFSRKVSEVYGILAHDGRHPLSTGEQDALLMKKFQQGKV